MAQIKKDTSLRKAILQAAITGQLISDVDYASFENQNSVSERSERQTGKELLDRIIEERNNKLLAEWEEKQTDLFASNDAHSKNAKTVRSEQIRLSKKIKKPEPIVASEIDEDEIPFEIPENWCWCRLGDLITFVGGYAFKSTDFNEVTNNQVIRLGNVKENSLILDQKQVFVSDLVAQQASSYQIKESDILVTMTGTRGKGDYFFTVYITDSVLNGKKLFINQRVGCLRTNSLISSKWLCFTLQSNFIRETIFEHETGTANQGNIGSEDIKKILLPLPPLEVQNVIVTKLEQVLPLVDAYENALLQKEELKSTLGDKVKKAILQEAITGQLTEGWRKSATIKESGKQLLDRIIEERNAKALSEWEEALKKNPKAKKPVPVVASEIEEDEIPFEVPESWCWCRLGEICNEIKRGKSPKYVDRSDYLAFAQKCNVKTGGIDLSLALYLDEKSIDRYSEEDNLIQGDVVINSTGGGTMGRVGYYKTKVPEEIKGVYPDSHVTVIRSVGNINQRYLYYILKHNQPVLEDCGTGSTNQTELKPGVLVNLVIPLPPLEEQEEIVKKVEELLPLCK